MLFIMKKITLLLLANIAIVLFITNSAKGQNIVPDSLFANKSRLVIPLSGATIGNFLLQPDGKIIYGGTATSISGDFAIAMMRFDECGILDPSFGTNGSLRHTFNVRNVGKAFAIQSDGKIVCVGVEAPSNAGSQQRANVSRFNSDGTPDTSFNVTGSHSIFNAAGSFDSVRIMDDGKIVCFGRFGSGLGSGIARFNTDGTLDTSFNTDGLAFFQGIFGFFEYTQGHLLPDGKMIVTSYTSTQASSDRRLLAARFLPSGEIDTTYGNNGVYYDAAIPVTGFFKPLTSVIDSNGNLLMSKNFDNTSFDILRLTPSGTLDSTFGTGGLVHYVSGGDTTGMQLFADGKILVRGTVPDGTFSAGCAIRFLADGTPDTTFGTNGLRVIDIKEASGSEALNSLLVLSNGQWIVAATSNEFYFRKYGDFNNFPHITRNGTILSTTGTGSYQWFLEGVAIDGAINQTFTATQNGNYTVEITDANGCKGTSAVFILSNLSLNDNSINKKTNIYPNPTTGIISISNEDNETIDKIEIVDILGKTVATKTGNASQVDITSLSNGMYVFKIYSGENVSIKKIIKE